MNNHEKDNIHAATAPSTAPALPLPVGHRADEYEPHVIVYDSDRVRAIVAEALSAGAAAKTEQAPMQLCPRCEGSGEGTMMVGAGPDAYEIDSNCEECGGIGEVSTSTAGAGSAQEPSNVYALALAVRNACLKVSADFRFPETMSAAEALFKVRGLTTQLNLADVIAAAIPGTSGQDGRAGAGSEQPHDVCAEMRALCSSCGGTGDVTSIVGEWRGECNCPAGIALALDRLKIAAAKTQRENEKLRAALAQQAVPEAPATAASASGPRLSIEQCIAQFGLYADSCDALGNTEGARRLRNCADFLRDHGPAPSRAADGQQGAVQAALDEAKLDAWWKYVRACKDGRKSFLSYEDWIVEQAALARAPLPAQGDCQGGAA